MKNIRLIVSAFIAIVFLFSCIKEDRDPADCMRKIIIEFDWSMVEEPDDSEDIEVLITDQNDDSIELHTDHDGTEVTLEPQWYEFVGDEGCETLLLKRCTLSIMRDANGEYIDPDYFVAGSVEQEIDADATIQVITIPMRQQTRPLIIRVLLNGELINLFSRATGTIDGITMSRHINEGFPPLDGQPLHASITNGPVEYTLSRTATNTYSDTKYLIGKDGSARQTVNFDVYFTNGTVQTISQDVTSRMYGFHTENVTEPWILEFTLGVTPEEPTEIGSMRVTIESWRGGAESHLIAE